MVGLMDINNGVRRISSHPTGEWVAQSHQKWEWFYCENEDTPYHQAHYTISGTTTKVRIQSRQEYHHTQAIGRIPACCVPANVLVLQEIQETFFTGRAYDHHLHPRSKRPIFLGFSTLPGGRVDVGPCTGRRDQCHMGQHRTCKRIIYWDHGQLI
jgi:hypothetical protein